MFFREKKDTKKIRIKKVQREGVISGCTCANATALFWYKQLRLLRVWSYTGWVQQTYWNSIRMWCTWWKRLVLRWICSMHTSGPLQWEVTRFTTATTAGLSHCWRCKKSRGIVVSLELLCALLGPVWKGCGFLLGAKQDCGCSCSQAGLSAAMATQKRWRVPVLLPGWAVQCCCHWWLCTSWGTAAGVAFVDSPASL